MGIIPAITNHFPAEVSYYASAAFAYIKFVFKNYPVDWDGFYIELLDNENDFTVFHEANFFPFRPANSVAYNSDGEIILKDYDEEWIYYDNGTPIEDPLEINFMSEKKVQIDTKRIQLSRDRSEEKILFFAGYRILGGRKYIGNINKEIVVPGQNNFINIVEQLEIKDTDIVITHGTGKTLYDIFNHLTASFIVDFEERVDEDDGDILSDNLTRELLLFFYGPEFYEKTIPVIPTNKVSISETKKLHEIFNPEDNHKLAMGEKTGLGTASQRNTGNDEDEIPLLDEDGKFPANLTLVLRRTYEGTVNANIDTITLTDGDYFDINWVGENIKINNISHEVLEVIDSETLKIMGPLSGEGYSYEKEVLRDLGELITLEGRITSKFVKIEIKVGEDEYGSTTLENYLNDLEERAQAAGVQEPQYNSDYPLDPKK